MELTTSALLLAMLGLALVDSINPSAIVMTAFIVTKAPTTSRKRAVLAYVAGIFCLYFGTSVLLTAGVSVLRDVAAESVVTKVLMVAQTAIGGAMLWWAIAQPHFTTKFDRYAVTAFSTKALFGLGMFITLVELVTAFPYIAATGLLQQAHMAFVAKVGILAAYTGIFVLPPLILLAIYTRNQARVTRWLEGRRRKKNGSNETMRWIVGAIGGMLAVNALSAFSS